MPGTIDFYSEDFDSAEDVYERFLNIKQTQKRNAWARKKLEKRFERKQLRKNIEDFYDYD